MRILKKIFLPLFILLITTLSLTSCGEETVTLNVYNWGEYISDGFQGSLDVNAAFEDYYYKTHGVKLKVVYSTYATNEDMYSKLSSNAGSYDIVIPSDYMIEKMKNEGMLLAFDANSIPNYKNIDSAFKGLYYDDKEMYSVPYTYGMMGVIYNTEFVDAEDVADKSWGLLWNEKYKGKILQFNNPRDAFGSAMYYLGIDINSDKTSDWDRALAKLTEQKPIIQAYVNDEIFNKMTTASAVAAPYFAGDYLAMSWQNEDLSFYYPTEGTNYFVDAMCIPANASNPEIAKEYINFMLSEEVAVANALYIGYASPNTLVVNNKDYQDEMGDYAMEILYGTPPSEVNGYYESVINGTACYKSFSPEIQAYVNTLWESLKTENATEPWIHVCTGIIVGGVVILASYNYYIKKKRSRDYRLRDKNAKAKKSA